MSWLDALLDPSETPRRTLVLCHGSASATAVRRFLATRSGQVGIEILTPLGLARSLEPHRLLPDDTGEAEKPALPTDHPWASISDRPGLAAILGDHL
ncbi:MAG TPA: hypothetical protein PK313_09850, partial [Myxococcota bacterium]|nr:hypothetical protein [Myxococcota bacterium]